jgi:hypothetical protein
MCEPVGSHRFPTLDRHLLRHSLEVAFRNTHAYGRSRKQAKRIFETQVQMMLHGIAPGELTTDQWKRFLTYEEAETLPQILKDANGTAGVRNPKHSRQVLARAMLLLRVATGASQKLLKSLPGVDRSELQFWWLRLGKDRGLWHDGDELTSFVDLWADVRDALDDVTQWLEHPPTSAVSYNKLWREKPSAAAILAHRSE